MLYLDHFFWLSIELILDLIYLYLQIDNYLHYLKLKIDDLV